MKKAIVIGSIILNLVLVSGYIQISKHNQSLSDKHQKCIAVIKDLDNLLGDINDDHKMMSRLAVNYINKQTLLAQDVPIYDKLKENNQTESDWYNRILEAYHTTCE